MKNIQIGDVFGEVQEVQLKDDQTIQDALNQAGLAISAAQKLVANGTNRTINANDIPVENEVYLITSNQTSG